MPNRKAKILHLIPCFAIGGAEIMAYHYAKNLNKDKYEVYTASCVEDGELRQQFEKDNLNIFVGSRQKHGGRWGVWQKLKQYVGELQPDLVHSHLISSDLIAYLLKKHSGGKLPWVSTQHNIEFDRPWYYRAVWRHILPKADRVIAVSPVVGQYINKYLAVPKERLKIILNGINLAPLLAQPALTPNKKCLEIATIGRIEKQKGHIYLLQALVSIKDIFWQWHIFGAGSLQDNLKQEAEKLRLTKQITWHGITANLSQEFTNIQLVIQPSLWEGLSLVVMEAMASGRVVIASQPAGEDLITHKQTGYIVPAKNSQALAVMIREVLKNSQEMIEVGQNARQYARENFSLEKNVKQVETIYNELLKNHA